jgi:superfamily II DNA or RNA helicase
MRGSVPAPGAMVWVRQRRWRVERAHRDRGIVRIDVADHETRLTVLVPFDRIITTAPIRRTIRVRRQHARARMLAVAGSTTSQRLVASARDARIDLWPHQFEPVLAVLAGQRRLLIADEVGLGKTIQAGLILAELRRRQPDYRALVIAPAGLRDQWAEELATRFDIRAEVADRDGLTLVEQASSRSRELPWSKPGVWLASADYLKQHHVFDSLPLTPWDLVVIDEAHLMTGRSDRHEACDELGRRARHLILLSATPHSGDERRYTRLLQLGALGPADNLCAFRRTRATASLPIVRHVRWHRVPLAPPARRLLDALLAFERFVLAHARGSTQDAALLLLSVFRRRALSTMHACEVTLARRLEWLAAPERAYTLDWLQPRLDFGSDEDDLSDDERTSLIADLGLPAGEERTWLRRLRTLALDAGCADPKLSRLHALLGRTNEAVVVFTEFRHSLERARDLLAGVRSVAALHGSQPPTERRSELQRFLSGEASVLLSTDVGGQGLNLQHAARWVINLELPWNPVRLEQRIGRVDRIGQRRVVHATMLIADHPGENLVLAGLARRALAAQQVLGPSALAATTPPSTLTVARSLFAGRALPDTSNAIRPLPLTTDWIRAGRASTRVLARRRAWRQRWSGPAHTHARPIAFGERVSTGGPGRTTLGYTVSILDGAGETVERHCVVVTIEGALDDDRLPPDLAEALEARVVRALAARLRRTRRLVVAKAARTLASERAIAVHLHGRRRPEDGQLGLFSQRHSARAVDRELLERALREDDTRARLALEEARTALSIGRPELVWMWAIRG